MGNITPTTDESSSSVNSRAPADTLDEPSGSAGLAARERTELAKQAQAKVDAVKAAYAARRDEWIANGSDDLREAWVSLCENSSNTNVTQWPLAAILKVIAKTGRITVTTRYGAKQVDLEAVIARVKALYQEGYQAALDLNAKAISEAIKNHGLEVAVEDVEPLLHKVEGKLKKGKDGKDTKEVQLFLTAIKVGDKEYPSQPPKRFYSPVAMGKEHANDAKTHQLPAVVFSGVFKPSRKREYFFRPTGLYALDLDAVRDKEALWAAIVADPNVFFAFISPTGSGIKVVVYGPKASSSDEYTAIYKRMAKLKKQQWNTDAVDEVTNNSDRLCYLGFYPDAYVNWNVVPTTEQELPPVAPEPAPKQTVKTDAGALKAAFEAGTSHADHDDDPDVSLETRRAIAEGFLGKIDWDTDDHGFCICPGAETHTGNKEKDCEVHVDGAATIHCLHQHCVEAVDEMNHQLRSTIGKAKWKIRKKGIRAAEMATMEADEDKLAEASNIKDDAAPTPEGAVVTTPEAGTVSAAAPPAREPKATTNPAAKAHPPAEAQAPDQREPEAMDPNRLLTLFYPELVERYGEPFDFVWKISDPDPPIWVPRAINERFFTCFITLESGESEPAVYDMNENKWFRYNAKRGFWEHIVSEALLDVLNKKLLWLGKECECATVKTNRLKFAFRTLKTLSPVVTVAKGTAPVNSKFWQRPVLMLPLANGVLDMAKLLNGEKNPLLLHSLDYHFRGALDIAFDPDAQCPQWDKLVERALPDDDLDLLDRWQGSMLLGYNLAQKLLMLMGTPASGKSVIAHITAGVIGPDNTGTLRTSQLDGRFEIGRLRHKLLIFAADVPANSLTTPGAAIIKQITGGDPVSPEFKHSNARPPAEAIDGAVLVTANSRLRMRFEGDQEAWRRRIVPILFDREGVSEAKQITGLARKLLAEEGPGILNRMLLGLRKFCQDDCKLLLNERQTKIRDALIGESDSCVQFVKEALEPSKGSSVLSETAYRAYVTFAHEREWMPDAENDFYKAAGPAISDLCGISQCHNLGLHRSKRGWRGIKLNALYAQSWLDANE